LRLLFAFPLAVVTFFLSVAFFTDARERRELRTLVVKMFGWRALT